MAKADNKLHFRCTCGEKVEATWKSKGWFGKKQWIADSCRVCRTVADLSSIEVIPCPHCQRIVIKGEQYCMECNQPLDYTIENLPITCPNEECGLTIYLPRNYKGDYTCRFCERKIHEDEIHRQMKAHGTDPQPAVLIELPSLPAMEGRIIHQESIQRLPYGSSVQVSTGTYGLLVQNGECQYPLDPGIHLLPGSKLSKNARLEAFARDEETIFNTEIFCVVKKLPELTHSLHSIPAKAKPVEDAPAREFVTSACCIIRCQVDDAKAFVTQMGVKPLSETEFLASNSWMSTRTQELLSTAFNKAVEKAFEIYDATQSTYTYSAELCRLIKDTVSNELVEYGLYLENLKLEGLDVAETEESKQIQREHEIANKDIETVKLPDMQQMQQDMLIIAKHDKDEFAYKSRVQVNEGTWGLMLQNGHCQDPLKSGSYLLADCPLQGVSRYNAALHGNDVVFKTDLYTVLQKLPVFEWYHPASFIDAEGDNGAPAKEYTVKVGGSVVLQVDDPRAFASAVGFAPLSVGKLFHARRPVGQLPTFNITAEANISADQEDGWLYTRVKSVLRTTLAGICQAVFGQRLDVRLMSLYQLHFTGMLQDHFNNQLKKFGLSVVTLDLTTFAAKETPESEERIAEYYLKRKQDEAEREIKRQACEATIKAAQTLFSWNAANVELHMRDHLELKAYADFQGTCRLSIIDPDTFFTISEINDATISFKPDQAQKFCKDYVLNLLVKHLSGITQEYIDSGKIADLMDRSAYSKVAESVKNTVDQELILNGLKLHELSIGQPSTITPSKALTDFKAIGEKKDKIRAYAEKALKLKTDPILVHMRDDASVFVKTVLGGTAYLRVSDETAFFGTSEVKAFLSSDPFVSESEVIAYYTQRINSLFADIISCILQAIVDQTNADIRELNRLSVLLKNNVLNHLNDRVNGFGMRLESLDMSTPSETERSSNMMTWIQKHEVQSDLALQQEIDKLLNDHAIFKYSEGLRVDIAKAQADSQMQKQLDDIQISNMESEDRVIDKATELEEKAAARAQRKADRIFQEQMDKLRKDDELQRLADGLASARKAFDFEELQKKYEREYFIRELVINQNIREAQLRAEAQYDAQARADKAKFDSLLNDAENKRIMNDILHKIAQSDLDWQKKLDEYDRLKKQTAVDDQLEEMLKKAQAQAKQDAIKTHTQVELDDVVAKSLNEQKVAAAKAQAEADKATSAVEQMILREENATFLLAGEAKIKLSNAEADLLEKIASYQEDRRKRMLDSDADRNERRAILDFEQRMRDRQEQVAQDMEKLKQQHEYDLAIREKDDQLATLQYEQQKLQFILNHMTTELTTRADVDKARIHADEEIKKAVAQFDAQHAHEQMKAAEDRLKAQLASDEKTAQAAQAFQEKMADIQLTIEKLRHETEQNKDNNDAKVAIAQAQSADKQNQQQIRQSIDRLSSRMEQRYRDLQRDMDKITAAHKELKKKVQNLSEKMPPFGLVPPPLPPVTVYPGPQPGGVYGFNQNILNTAGQATTPVSQVDPNALQQSGLTLSPNDLVLPVTNSAVATGTKICPVCHKQCSIHASVCQHCGTSL